MPHVDDGTLHALLDGALRAHEPDRADRVEAHLDACADCRARFDEAAELRDRAADVLGALDAGLAPEDATGAANAAEPVPDFQDVLDRASAGQGGVEPDSGAAGPTDGAGRSGRAGDIRRRYQWTRGLAWAATIVVALGTGYLVRDLAGPTGVVPARSAVEQGAEGPVAEEDGAAVGGGEAVSAAQRGAASGDEPAARRSDPALDAESPAAPGGTEASAGVDQDAAAARAAPEAQAGAGGEPDPAAKAAVRADEPRPELTAPAGERERVAADALAPAGAVDSQAGNVAAGAAVTGAAAETPWRTVTLEEAEARAGVVLRLPTASIVSVELGPDGSVRTLQRLGGGVEVEVLQESRETLAVEEAGAAPAEDRAARQRAEAQAIETRAAAAEAQVDAAQSQPEAEAAVAAAMAPTAAVPSLMGLDLDSAAATVAAPVTVAVARDGYVLTLTGLLPEHVLRALAATAAPRAP